MNIIIIIAIVIIIIIIIIIFIIIVIVIITDMVIIFATRIFCFRFDDIHKSCWFTVLPNFSFILQPKEIRKTIISA